MMGHNAGKESYLVDFIIHAVDKLCGGVETKEV